MAIATISSPPNFTVATASESPSSDDGVPRRASSPSDGTDRHAADNVGDPPTATSDATLSSTSTTSVRSVAAGHADDERPTEPGGDFAVLLASMLTTQSATTPQPKPPGGPSVPISTSAPLGAIAIPAQAPGADADALVARPPIPSMGTSIVAPSSVGPSAPTASFAPVTPPPISASVASDSRVATEAVAATGAAADAASQPHEPVAATTKPDRSLVPPSGLSLSPGPQDPVNLSGPANPANPAKPANPSVPPDPAVPANPPVAAVPVVPPNPEAPSDATAMEVHGPPASSVEPLGPQPFELFPASAPRALAAPPEDMHTNDAGDIPIAGSPVDANVVNVPTAVLSQAPSPVKTLTGRGASVGRDDTVAKTSPIEAGVGPIAPAPAPAAPVVAKTNVPGASVPSEIASTSPRELADQVVTSAHRFRGQDGTHHMSLELNPVDLGSVSIRLTVEGSTVSMQMIAEREATGELLRSSLAELRLSLSSGGFTASSLGVGQHSAPTGGHTGQPSPHPDFARDSSAQPTSTEGMDARSNSALQRLRAVSNRTGGARASQLDLQL